MTRKVFLCCFFATLMICHTKEAVQRSVCLFSFMLENQEICDE